ncbi:MAG: CDP-diacylglycerol--glycerol-3-phosphate 3-phosphatidyltransferase [Acidobacteriota bacterium]|nr:CDP-diacylglycerol--glycerol-3-phosphate 3-phosphatidyltransferase [Blastocatellia bacterium]MDW8412366.1 CDP-diacylglycerol--glycerol-3-phosphate 3-phosphatidyltransferase [Acidobacteriota bacterium]
MNLPNSLTILRIFLVPLLVVVLLTRLSEDWFGISQQTLGVALFLLAALTDLLDGWLARRRGQITTLGTLLDPIADKLLISAAFISLVENRLAPAWAVVIVIAREFAVSGLRSIAAAEGFTIAASKMGKLKMVAQVLAITLLIVGSDNGAPPVNGSSYFAARAAFEAVLAGEGSLRDLQVLCYGLGRAMLWIVVFSALYSMYGYFRKFYGKVRDRIQVRERRRLRELIRRRRRIPYGESFGHQTPDLP